MAKSLYVGNLSFDATEEDLREAFEAHGEVSSARIISDRATGRSRGFAFVEMDDESAEAAMEAMNGAELKGRALRVNEARERKSGGPRKNNY